MTAKTVTVKGRVTIPKKVRDGLGLKDGDKVAFVSELIHRNLRECVQFGFKRRCGEL